MALDQPIEFSRVDMGGKQTIACTESDQQRLGGDVWHVWLWPRALAV